MPGVCQTYQAWVSSGFLGPWGWFLLHDLQTLSISGPLWVFRSLPHCHSGDICGPLQGSSGRVPLVTWGEARTLRVAGLRLSGLCCWSSLRLSSWPLGCWYSAI